MLIAMRIALVLYDYVVTFAEEVEHIWKYKGSKKAYIGAILFLGNRYVSILYGVVGFVVDLFPIVCLSRVFPQVDPDRLDLFFRRTFLLPYR